MSTNRAGHKPLIVAVVGPTASGKTSIGVDLARRFGGEVVSADSRQVYRGMDIGSGKATRREMRGIPHHMLDVASPKRTFSVARFKSKGEKIIKRILQNGKLPIVVGGTGFYVDALLHGAAIPSVKPDAALRRRLEHRTTDDLFSELRRRDPRRARTIDRHNRRRLVRALEIVISTGRPVPEPAAATSAQSPYRVLMIGIAREPDDLKRRIAKRLHERLRRGMIAEVKRLHDKDGISWKRLDGFGLEYRYVSRYLRGFVTRDEMAKSLEHEIWLYAKRQMTWFRRNSDIHWVSSVTQAASLVKGALRKSDWAIKK